MTPAELVVLFSGYVITFTLIWFTSLVERFEESAPKATEREKAEHFRNEDELSSSDGESGEDVPYAGREFKWNVGAFLGLNRQEKRA